ncbi:MAG: AMP-binding protein [Jatrophihabitans sp.]|uniref:AMP-binding protein n=1 Tax=Jatrophihabitans sp. TaxID=1932789 RepID=UPI003F7CDD74
MRYPRDEVVLPLVIEQRAGTIPDRPYLVDVEGGSSTYGELHARALLWARALMRLGVQPGARVVTMLHNTVENYALWFGIAWAGAVEVPVNVDLRGTVLAHQLRLPAAELVIADASAVANIMAAAESVPALQRVITLQEPEDAAGRLTVLPVADVLAGVDDEPVRPYAELQPWDIASVIYTSGTTGPSKGVLMPWGQLHAGQMLTVTGVLGGPSPDKVMYVTGPPNHVQAKGAAAVMAMLGGVAVMRHAFSGSRFWDEVRQYRATDAALIGAMAQFLLSAPPRPDDADTTLTNVLMAPVVPAVDEFNARFGTRVWSAYNMTEISVPTYLGEWRPGDTPNCGPIREGYPSYELRIVDAHDHEVADGEVGELILRTAEPWTLNAGYLDMPQATVDAWRNGWFHTGDAFRRDEQGRYLFVDRLKDTIRRRGENVSSYEVEAEAILHPGVLECAAIAVPADEAEDEIKLVVIRQPDSAVTAEQLWAYLDERLPRFMVPRYVEFLDALPKTPTLRVQKALIPRTVDGAHDRTQVSP